MTAGTARAVMPRPSFQPKVAVADAVAAHWLGQVTLRLRREVCWLWRERGALADAGSTDPLLPPYADPLASVLDLARYDEEKRVFFARDATAGYLTRCLDAPPPQGPGLAPPRRGSFGWLVRELALAPVDCFALALALSAVVDSASATVFAAVLNDPQRTAPTLGLAQRLWDEPAEVMTLLGSEHALARYGLVAGSRLDWETPLVVAPAVAGRLLDAEEAGGLRPVEAWEAAAARRPPTEMVVAALRAARRDRPRVVPVVGAREAPLAEVAAAVAAEADQTLRQPFAGAGPADLPALATLAWLDGTALYAPAALCHLEGLDRAAGPPPLPPITLFVGVSDGGVWRGPDAELLPGVTVPALDHATRLACWHDELPATRTDPALARAAADCARRFRGERTAVVRAARALRALGRPVRGEDLYAACRADVDLGTLAQRIVPRFALTELMLPPRQTRQVTELIRALGALTTVHFEWGTARAWNESGLSALFAGSPGTGKTMTAEVIAAEVGMPLYRVDLSQVVNKYIGETEKNLRRLFDAADATDVILFFDEADALFGRRTEVKDAHDRYANLEVSYLLERMERFKGLAILATNRKRDLDEAFLRRLRYLIDFPLPGPEERLRIWRGALPPEVDARALDLPFLADRFPLAGGHIRAIVFQACLQSAESGGGRVLSMPAVARAIRNELEKLGRPISLDRFGPHARHVED